MWKADKNLFDMMTFILQSRHLDTKDVSSHPLGSILGHLQLVMAHCVKQTKQP